jgi:hypothetical protein
MFSGKLRSTGTVLLVLAVGGMGAGVALSQKGNSVMRQISEKIEKGELVLQPPGKVEPWGFWQEERFQLAPGKHVVRVALPLGRFPDPYPVPNDLKGIRPMSRAVEIVIGKGKAAGAPPDWGEAAEGVKVRLRPNKVEWAAGETPTFQLDLLNQSKEDFGGCRIAQGCEIEIDGKWYLDNSSPVDCPASVIKPGSQVDGWLRISLGHLLPYKLSTEQPITLTGPLPPDYVYITDPAKLPGAVSGYQFLTEAAKTSIRAAKICIELAAKKLRESKDDRSMREALAELERSVGLLKSLLKDR